MMPAATPEALEQALAEFQRRNGYHRPEIEELLMEFGELVLATATAEAASLRAEVEALRAALTTVKTWIDTDLPAGTSRAGFMHRVLTKALDRAALARAATALEGRSDELERLQKEIKDMRTELDALIQEVLRNG